MVPGTIFFLAWYLGFILLAGYAPDFMGEEFLVDGITVGYVLALSQFVMVWVLDRPGTCAARTGSSIRSPRRRRSARSRWARARRSVKDASSARPAPDQHPPPSSARGA